VADRFQYLLLFLTTILESKNIKPSTKDIKHKFPKLLFKKKEILQELSLQNLILNEEEPTA